MSIEKNQYSLADLMTKASCGCMPCPCNGKSAKTSDGASGSQNGAGKEKKLNNPSGCS